MAIQENSNISLKLNLITTTITYAFFNYVKQGTTENSITTGTITFLYTEVSGIGRGISLSDAYPISDEVGKVQTGEGNVFDFKVTSTTPDNSAIPYEITARKKDTSTLDESAVKLYLTKVSGDSEEEVLLDNYSNLTQTTKVSADKYIEKTLYTSKVPANSTSYEQAYRLRMWIDEDTDFSPVEDSNGNITYPYNDKEFTVTVNVYANAKVVTDEDIANESKAEISSLSVNGEELTKIENEDYDYETTLSEGTTSVSINVETISEYATVAVERIDSLAYETSSIKRLSTKKTLELEPGDNYFKIIVTSENKEIANEYIIKISVKYVEKVTIFNKTFEVVDTKPTLTGSSINDKSGLYKSIETNSGNPTYYFRGNVENNYVNFAEFIWRVVRINEDGTIRLIMQNPMNDSYYRFYSATATSFTFNDMYYQNSFLITALENWYQDYIVNKGYSNSVKSGDYFCEQAKVKSASSYTSGSASMTVYSSYTPNFRCETDGNGKGVVNASIGLINYDEAVYAGMHIGNSNSDSYLSNGVNYWTMSPGGVYSSGTGVSIWVISGTNGSMSSDASSLSLVPIINLDSNVTVTGEGTSTSPWVVQ